MQNLNIFNEYKGLPKPVYIMFIARIVNKAGEFVKFFLALFLSANLMLPKKEVGFYVMLVGLSMMLGTTSSGKLADKFGRKKLFIGVQALSAISLIISGFYTDSKVIIWFIMLSSFFLGASVPINKAIVTDLTTKEQRMKAFSLLYLATNFGVALGPLLAGFLFNNYIKWIFWGDGITMLVSVVLIFFFVPETLPNEDKIENSSSSERATTGSTFSALMERPTLVIFAVIMILANFVYGQHNFLIPLQMNEVFGSNGAKYFGYLLSANALIVILSTIYVLKISKNYKPETNIIFAVLLYAVGFGMLAHNGIFIYFLVSTFIWTIGEILHVTNYNVFVADHTPITHRGRFNGIFAILHSLGYMFSPLISGLMLDYFSMSTIWIMISFVSILTMILLYMNTKLSDSIVIKYINRFRKVQKY